MRLEEAVRRARYRLARTVRPAVTVTSPPSGVVFDRDVPVIVRDGVTLRVNVFRPEAAGGHPVLLCAHPYGKDHLPRARPGGGYRPPLQARMLPQSVPYRISAWTSWEAPDPAFWVPRGYVLVNADLRGWGSSEGVGTLLSAQEADDYHDLVEWAGGQPWSNGRVGLAGVSYLAIAQWAAASTRPPHLAAIAPWEGFTDPYRDFLRPGGIREDGFVIVWYRGLKAQRRSPVTIRRDQVAHPLDDAFWRRRRRPIEQIDVPVLVCGSFSDHNLHSAGAFHGFGAVSSADRWLYTHRGPKWSTFYGAEACAFQAAFFDHFLRGDDTGIDAVPPVRLEVREDADTVVSVRHETQWPLPSTAWRRLHLDAGSASLADEPAAPGRMAFDTRSGRVTLRHRFADDTEVTGPMVLRLHLEAVGLDDVAVFAGVRKWHDGAVVGFEGSYGFRDALVTCGWLKASHRRLDQGRSEPWAPFHTHDRAEPLSPGEVVTLEVPLLPSATLFRAGDELELVVQGRWFFSRNPLVGQFPAGYQRSRRGRAIVHTGGDRDSSLLVPVIPAPAGT